MVLNTRDDLPDPETPVNTVNRRLGISTLTSFRLFSRAPWTRIRSWASAGCRLEEAIFAIMPSSIDGLSIVPFHPPMHPLDRTDRQSPAVCYSCGPAVAATARGPG